jgi:Domain of unknown function (DUF4149)
MQVTLRTFRLLAIVLWVGGLCFFAFVLAPVAFHVLPSTHEAGLVVGGTLRLLHMIGLACGLVFYMTTVYLWLWAEVSERVGFIIQMTLMAVMLAITAWSQFHVLPAMEVDRALAGGDVDAAAPSNPGRIDFERLHIQSERLEGLILLCGLGVVYLLARESLWPEPAKIKQTRSVL